MDQLSLPFRIALVAILAAGALYLVVLKPSGAPVPASATPATPSVKATATPAKKATAPGVTGLTSAVDKARGAAAAQSGSDAATADGAATASETSTGAGAPVAIAPVKPAAPVTTPGTSATAKPAPAAATTAVKPPEPAADPSVRLLAALDRGRTVVVLFAGRTAADDLSVRRALRRADRRGGAVDVHVVPLARVGDFEAITRGVQVQQSPTLLVIGKSRQAREIVGFTTTREIDQLVADVRRG